MENLQLTLREQYTFWRRKNNVKLVEVAKFIGCSPAILSLWERNKCNMSDEKIKAYSRFITQYTTN